MITEISLDQQRAPTVQMLPVPHPLQAPRAGDDCAPQTSVLSGSGLCFKGKQPEAHWLDPMWPEEMWPVQSGGCGCCPTPVPPEVKMRVHLKWTVLKYWLLHKLWS